MKNSLIKKTVKISIIEGVLAQIYGSLSSIGSSFITKFAILLQAKPVHFSLITAISQFSMLFEPVGYLLTRKKIKVKTPTIAYVFFGRLLTMFLGLSLFLPSSSRIKIFLLILVLSGALNSISSNMWTAWISNIIPLRVRGRFFSRRSQYLLGASLLIGYAATFFVDMFSGEEGALAYRFANLLACRKLFIPAHQGYALAFIFAVGSCIGLLGLKILARQPELERLPEEASLSDLLREVFGNKNFRRLITYSLWWTIAIGVGSPFWGYFMLEKLKMSMLQMQLYGTISTFASLWAFRYWGKFIDQFGNKTAMKIAIVLGGINPLLWLFVSRNSYHLLWLEAITSGIMWSGAGVVASNFVLSLAPRGKVQLYSGVYGAINGIGMMASVLFSGTFLIDRIYLPGLNLQPEQYLFGLTGILRFTALIPLYFVEEQRAKPLRVALWMLNNSAKVKTLQLKNWMFDLLGKKDE